MSEQTPGQEAAGMPEQAHETEFDRRMLEALICPQSHGRLEYDAARQELVSPQAALAFPIRSGIPILLIDEARSLD